VGRAASWFAYPGGKALNAARTAGLLGAKVELTALAPSEWATNLREFLGKYGVTLRHIVSPGDGRVCVMLNERGRETVINTDLSMNLTRDVFQELAAAVLKDSRRRGFIVFSGSPPPSLSVSRYRALLRMASAGMADLVLDQTGRWLKAGMSFSPWLIKPNLAEFHSAIGRRTRSWDDMLRALEGVRAQGAKRILLSLGAKGCLLVSPEGRWFAPPVREPATPSGLSPLGSGDALLGGFLRAVTAGETEDSALKWGVAAATANLLHRGSCFMTAAEIRGFLPRVRVRVV
jgi:1-phosphofructokinase family hexose kinase